MTRIFFRLWLAASVLFSVTFVLHETATLFFWSDAEVGYWQQFYIGSYRAAAAELGAAPDPEAALPALQEQFEVSLALVSPDGLGGYGARQLQRSEAAWIPGASGDFYYVPVEPHGLLLRLGPYAPYPLPHLPSRLLLLFGGMALFAGAFWLVLRPLDRSQQAIARAAHMLASGDLRARIPSEDAPAAPDVAAAFNNMADRIEALLQSQQSMLRVASHELRTPIARMRLGLHLLGADPARTAALEDDLQELEDLVDEVLTHARLESDSESQRPEPTRLGPIVDGIVEGHPASGRVAFEVSAVVWQAPPVRAVPRLLQRALQNLVNNAARYAASTVQVGASVREGWVDVWVDDDGPGIPVDERERVLLPFTRLGAQGGYGMGLAIVARIVDWHGGRLAIEDADGGGCRVRLSWPAAG